MNSSLSNNLMTSTPIRPAREDFIPEQSSQQRAPPATEFHSLSVDRLEQQSRQAPANATESSSIRRLDELMRKYRKDDVRYTYLYRNRMIVNGFYFRRTILG